MQLETAKKNIGASLDAPNKLISMLSQMAQQFKGFPGVDEVIKKIENFKESKGYKELLEENESINSGTITGSNLEDEYAKLSQSAALHSAKCAEALDLIAKDLLILKFKYQEQQKQKSAASGSKSKTSGSDEGKLSVDPPYLKLEVVKKVAETLEEKTNNGGSLDFRRLAQKLRAAFDAWPEAQSSDKEKHAKLLEQVVMTPGYGYVELPKEVYLSDLQVIELQQKAYKHMKDANLPGTENIWRAVIADHISNLRRKIAPTKDLVGKEIPEKTLAAINKSIKPAIYCAYGPPGTGKTTIAEEIAKALDKSYTAVQMEGKSSIEDLTGRGPHWSGGPNPSFAADVKKSTAEAAAEAKSKGETKYTGGAFITLDEIEKAPEEVLRKMGPILGTQRQYQDSWLDVPIDTKDCTIYVAANRIDSLPPHVKSRLRFIRFPGYSDEQKWTILSSIIVDQSDASHLDKKFTFKTDIKENKDRKRKDGTTPYEGFEFSENVAEDGIKYFIENYVTEPGVREAQSMMKSLIDAAIEKYDDDRARAINMAIQANNNNISEIDLDAIRVDKVVVDSQFIHQVLGQPKKDVKQIKASKKIVEAAEEGFDKLATEILSDLDNVSPEESTIRGKINNLNKMYNEELQKNRVIISELYKKRIGSPEHDKEATQEQFDYYIGGNENDRVRIESLEKEIEQKFGKKEVVEESEEKHELDGIDNNLNNFSKDIPEIIEFREKIEALRQELKKEKNPAITRKIRDLNGKIEAYERQRLNDTKASAEAIQLLSKQWGELNDDRATALNGNELSMKGYIDEKIKAYKDSNNLKKTDIYELERSIFRFQNTYLDRIRNESINKATQVAEAGNTQLSSMLKILSSAISTLGDKSEVREAAAATNIAVQAAKDEFSQQLNTVSQALNELKQQTASASTDKAKIDSGKLQTILEKTNEVSQKFSETIGDFISSNAGFTALIGSDKNDLMSEIREKEAELQKARLELDDKINQATNAASKSASQSKQQALQANQILQKQLRAQSLYNTSMLDLLGKMSKENLEISVAAKERAKEASEELKNIQQGISKAVSQSNLKTAASSTVQLNTLKGIAKQTEDFLKKFDEVLGTGNDSEGKKEGLLPQVESMKLKIDLMEKEAKQALDGKLEVNIKEAEEKNKALTELLTVISKTLEELTKRSVADATASVESGTSTKSEIERMLKVLEKSIPQSGVEAEKKAADLNAIALALQGLTGGLKNAIATGSVQDSEIPALRSRIESLEQELIFENQNLNNSARASKRPREKSDVDENNPGSRSMLHGFQNQGSYTTSALKPSLIVGGNEFRSKLDTGFNVAQRLQKEALKKNKPTIGVADKLTSQDFDAICNKEITKINNMKVQDKQALDSVIHGVNQKLPHQTDEHRILQELKSSDLGQNKISVKGKNILSFAEQKDSKYTAVERFEHKLNTIAMYDTLSAEKKGADQFVIKDAGQPIVNVNHNPNGAVSIASEIADPKDKALLEMVLFAQKCSTTGKFKIEHCENNPEAGVKLYLYGKSLGLTPELTAATMSAIDNHLSQHPMDGLAAIYKMARNPNSGSDTVLVSLKAWEDKRKNPHKGL